jgi:hypothetical protein
MKNSNSEPKNSVKAGFEGTRGSVVPSGRTGLLAGFPGTSSLANLRGRFATPNQDLEVGKGGNQDAQKWEKAVQKGVFFPDEECFSRLFAAFPGFSHLFPHQFFSGSKIRQKVRRRTFAGKVTDFYAKLREVSRKFAQIRAVVTRFYAFLRVGPILDANFANEREFVNEYAGISGFDGEGADGDLVGGADQCLALEAGVGELK